VPIYEFVCEACGRLTEVMQKLSDPPPPACPECGEARLARLVSRTSFQLKGGGWYADLYASAGKGKAEPAGTSPAAKPDGAAAPAAPPAAPAAKPAAAAPAATKGKPEGKD
jgi:putative FmdB family regulatory protein